MKTILTVLVSTFLITALTSCEGYRCGNGQVFDKVTNSPLDSVLCEAVTGVQTKYTDKTGTFELCNRISGCIPHCKDITIRFSKPGYKTVSVDNPEDAIIYLEK